ncbi:Aste57867_14063 [Aphanomyces stellatus]|uniref:Aste57867_14063 protein n=1 Tax=Aphanomyces stellatus TaxID=120398 RepID=A0A485L025_9STRA|nr:hypothetical protein As57867_014012 [Aphanomyces stellatus]VFT90891.1 Aste57867_14063 [Aphanomyces stellatus]
MVPNSTELNSCEFFIRHLEDQADRYALDDEACKALLGLKLCAGKAAPSLNKLCNRTQRDYIVELKDGLDRQDGETVKVYTIRLMSFLRENGVPSHRGAAYFKSGVRHHAAESCLVNTNRDLQTVDDCMQLLKLRQLKLEESQTMFDRTRSRFRPSSAATTSASSNSSWGDHFPAPSPRRSRRTSSVEFEDQSTQATLSKILEALVSGQNKQQQDFVVQITQVQNNLLSALSRSLAQPSPYLVAPIQPQQSTAYAHPYAYPYAPAQAQVPAPTQAPVQSQASGQPEGQAQETTPKRVPCTTLSTSFVVSSKANDTTVNGAEVCGRCDRSGHGRLDCPRNTMRCNACHQTGHYAGELVNVCGRCK